MIRIANLLWLNSLKVINQRHNKAVIQIYSKLPALALNFSSNQSSSSASGHGNDKKIPDKDADEKKRKKQTPRITLISEGDKVEISTLEEAQKLASRRNLKLVKIVDLDTKTQRAIYKLMTGHEYLAEELKQREQKKAKRGGIKGEKLLTVSTRIASHDLQSKANLVVKWVQKNYEVRVIISRDGAENTKMEQIAKDIETVAEKDGRVVQKRVSGSDIRFSVLPVKKQEDDSGAEPISADTKTTSVDSANKQHIRSFSTDSS